MLTQQYSEQQRRAVNLVWTAAADYRFEPRFLALRTDGAPDFYMNCVIGYVHKWFGDDMPARLFASWAGDVRQAMLDDLAWLALENAAYERELPQRPALEELRAAHAAEFFSMEYQLSRQEWMNKNQLVYTLQSARWKGVLGERPPALNPWEKKLALIEQQHCTGNHLGCHLWFTRGTQPADRPRGAAAEHLAEQAAEQARLNRAAYARDSELYQSALLRLTEQIRNCMLVHRQPDAVPARQGQLDGARVWREPVLRDDRVFLRSDEDPKPAFTVDLLLDGSASRLHCQETIAAQGYILAKSLAACGIDVRVSSFCSLRGYTVLRILKDYGDRGGERRIFDYFAAGWNRDGLALRGAGQLLRAAPADKHLLILLTDASPDDSHKIPPTGKIPLSREYDGQAGVSDTADEVRALRRGGTRVAAVFMGESANVPNANAIYGRDLARIRRMDQLAAAAGRLIQDEIRELAD